MRAGVAAVAFGVGFTGSGVMGAAILSEGVAGIRVVIIMVRCSHAKDTLHLRRTAIGRLCLALMVPPGATLRRIRDSPSPPIIPVLSEDWRRRNFLLDEAGS